MPTDFGREFTEFAVPTLTENFHERDEYGDYLTLKYWPGSIAVEPLLFAGAKSSIKSVVQYTQDGEVRQETRTWQILRSDLDGRTIPHPQRNAVAEDTDGRWNVNVSECIWDEVYVTLALTRAPRTAGNELRSGAV